MEEWIAAIQANISSSPFYEMIQKRKDRSASQQITKSPTPRNSIRSKSPPSLWRGVGSPSSPSSPSSSLTSPSAKKNQALALQSPTASASSSFPSSPPLPPLPAMGVNTSSRSHLGSTASSISSVHQSQHANFPPPLERQISSPPALLTQMMGSLSPKNQNSQIG